MKIKPHLISFNTIVIKEVNRFTRIWLQTIVPPAVSMTLYFIIFGHLIGPRIGTMHGVGYIDFICPGIIMMAIINNSYANVVSSFFSAKFQRHIEEILVAPVSSFTILAGFVTGGAVRGLAVGLVVTLIALYFTDLHISNYLIVITVVFLTAVLFSIAGLLNAIFAKKFDDISIVPTFILTPLIYLGGVFYSIDLLPGFWQTVSLLNPILYMVNAFRYGMLGVSDINIVTAFVIICAFILALAGYALYLLHKGTGIKS
ncbi:MAG: ABC transporter permease [Gammaproteobacteria bacterium RIFCSPLOWO2_12_FULL_52_10]|nr:MAG: ABC transporter permease [Gammaproteobacteria bacterium RIFCSPLOWO2_12_FULL_52_10]